MKNGKVLLLKDYGQISYYTLVENDSEYFLECIELCKKTKYSSTECTLVPTKEDWEYIRNNVTIIVLPITTKCNSGCNICFMKERDSTYEEMSIEDIKRVLSKIGKNKKVLLFGGEPTVRKDIFKIIRLIRKSGNIPSICTNGLKLADENFVKKLKKSGIERVLLSFDGFREEIYEKLRGNKKHLYLKLKALKNLEKYNIKVYLSSTIAPGVNEDEVPKLLKFAAQNNHFIIGMNLYAATPYGRFNITQKEQFTPSDIINILNTASKGTINKEYVIEFKKLRANLHNISKKVGIFFPVCSYYHSHILLKVENSQVKHFIPIEHLKRINEYMKNKKFIPLVKYLIKNLKPTLAFIRLILSKFNAKSLGRNVLIIQLGNVITPLNYIPVEYDCTSIEKMEGFDVIRALGPG
jgi:uncharacterized radical SAM superfamily Fe-S cluster-containing enzyme